MTLQEKMIEFRKAKVLSDKLEAEIKAEIVELGESAVSEGIEAIYKTGRKTYKYEQAAKENASQDIIKECTKPKTDWTAACKKAGLVNIPFTEGEPSVAITIQKAIPAFPV